MILKVAVGVFLGLAAWTYASSIFGLLIALLGLILVALLAYWIYKLISNPIKNKMRQKSINEIFDELVSLSIVDKKIHGALSLGLLEKNYESNFNLLEHYLQKFKAEIRNGGNGKYYKDEILNLTNEIVAEFKTRKND